MVILIWSSASGAHTQWHTMRMFANVVWQSEDECFGAVATDPNG